MNNQSTGNETSAGTSSLPAKALKVLAVMAVIFAIMFFVVRGGAMRGYEQSAEDIKPGVHTTNSTEIQ